MRLLAPASNFGAILVLIAAASLVAIGNNADGARGQTGSSPSCTLQAGTPAAIHLAATKRERKLALLVRCSESITDVGIQSPNPKVIALGAKATIEGGSANGSLTCSTRTCQGSVLANVGIRLTATYRKKRACKAPPSDLTISAGFLPRPCPGPNPCPTNPLRTTAQASGFSGC